MTMDDFVRTLNSPDVTIRHIPPRLARVLAHLSPSLTPALMDLLLRDNITATPPAEIGAAIRLYAASSCRRVGPAKLTATQAASTIRSQARIGSQ